MYRSWGASASLNFAVHTVQCVCVCVCVGGQRGSSRVMLLLVPREMSDDSSELCQLIISNTIRWIILPISQSGCGHQEAQAWQAAVQLVLTNHLCLTGVILLQGAQQNSELCFVPNFPISRNPKKKKKKNCASSDLVTSVSVWQISSYSYQMVSIAKTCISTFRLLFEHALP